MAKKHICIHGHFYQPPRENPWLEEIEIQDSAYPFHDWNEKIARECYAPNTASRSLSAKGRIKKIVNNFEKISFNIGPTLFSWLKQYDHVTYNKIIEADKKSVISHKGHGSAIAQAYNHMIMPLASDRDKRTQILWGIADFIHHFGRKPEGLWLPETAVDKKTLAIMRDSGIKFTILSQGQARAARKTGEGEWHDLTESIDPTRAYSQPIEGGDPVAIFIYDGPISQAMAFEGLLKDGARYAERLRSGFSDKRDWDQILNTATDGETFGHHHRFGEMALTFALTHFESEEDVTLTNYGEYLASHPPEMEIDILDNSAWSCAHGVERWRSDCGCKVGANEDWNQKWRTPLRDALDYLKNVIDKVFETRGSELFKDPWKARDEYIEVILERDRAIKFLDRHQRGELSKKEKIQAMSLLEAERNGMLMYTSCGWFFDDVSGIETVQIMRYAARAIQLLGQVSNVDPEPEFIKILTRAKSNIKKEGNGGKLYKNEVLKEKASLTQIMANYIITHAVNLEEAFGKGASFTLSETGSRSEEYGDTSIAISCVNIKSLITLEEESRLAAILRLGVTDVSCFTSACDDLNHVELVEDIFTAFNKRELREVVRLLGDRFAEEVFTLEDLFMEGRRKAIDILFADHIHTFTKMYEQIFWRNRKMMDVFINTKSPLPMEFWLAAKYVLEKDIKSVAETIYQPGSVEKFNELMKEAQKWNVQINPGAIKKELDMAICRQVNKLITEKNIDASQGAIEALEAVKSSEIDLDLWGIQNQFAEAYYKWTQNHSHPFYGSEHMVKLGKLLNFAYD
ncbi:Alpha-amylase/alpha-mannosidase [hydrothermal vent metagenome]|uniref:Alpha-amylase/alpha-mannosidase n=1 Tax=hydrothermal vent metagenome TaxID=652676 RepID=A0A3B1C1J4_9ZZZZ